MQPAQYLNSMCHLMASSDCLLCVSPGNPVSVYSHIYPHIISTGEETNLYITLKDNYLLPYYNLHRVAISSHSSQS